MQAIDRFLRALWEVLDEWDDGERDFPDIDGLLADAASSATDPDAGIDPDKAKALLAGLWACDRLIESPDRTARRSAALREAYYFRGVAGFPSRQVARADAKKQYERIKSRLIYGFWLDRGRETPSKADIRTLLDALLLIIDVEATTQAERLEEIWGGFRSRVNGLRRSPENADASLTLFNQVYGAVLEYRGL